MLPKIIKDAILSVEGTSFAGRVENIEWPKLARKMEEWRGGGMMGPVEVDLGAEKMEMSFEMPEQDAELLKQFGVLSVSGTRFRINASAENDSPDNTSDAIEVIGLGRIKEIELGQYKGGDLQQTKYAVSLSAFRYSNNGTDIFDIDHLNNIFKVDGKDLLEKRRENLRQ